MKFYYTTSAGQNVVQADPKLSLGGYRSASLVPVNTFDSLFGEITQYLLSKPIPEDEFIGIILHNDGEETIDNLWLWLEYGTDKYSTLAVAAVDLVADAAGNLCMERIPTKFSAPMYAEFYEAENIENALSLGNIEADGMIGLWFRRTLVDDLATSIQQDANLYQADPAHTDMVIPTVPEKYDSISVKFIYGAEYYGGPIGDELL